MQHIKNRIDEIIDKASVDQSKGYALGCLDSNIISEIEYMRLMRYIMEKETQIIHKNHWDWNI